jgi:hypothetical protein
VLVYSVILIVFHFTVKGLFYRDCVFFELGQVDLDLADGHFGDELVHVHLFLTENGIGEFLPDLLYYVESRIHLVVL